MKRQEINEKMQETKESIQMALQRLHNETGLIPVKINFKSLKMQTGDQYIKKVSTILIVDVEITANI